MTTITQKNISKIVIDNKIWYKLTKLRLISRYFKGKYQVPFFEFSVILKFHKTTIINLGEFLPSVDLVILINC